MKIKRVKLTRFKRFTDLTVEELPETARLVILAGPNGCGKSSIFEALHTWHRYSWKGTGGNWDQTYHVKQLGLGTMEWNEATTVEFFDPQPETLDDRRKAIYVRTAYRNDPEFQVSQIQRTVSALEENRFDRLIDNDAAVGKNYQRLTSQGLEDVYEREDPATTIGDFRERSIGEIRDALRRIFPDLKLNSLGNPLTMGTFKFDKGASSGFLYRNLSGGEKAAFDLLLDIIVKKREFDDTVFCIDEPEAHMNTRLQGALLEEMCNLISPSSQLWLATHSIGMMRKARDLYAANPDNVVFLDLDGKDFDGTEVLRPITPSRVFWQRVLNVALDDLAELIAPERVVICEGAPLGGAGKNVAHDAQCYDKVFGHDLPETRFLSAGNADAVETDRLALIEAIEALVGGTQIIRLVDRDDRSPDEIAELARQGVRVLSRRHLESYLFDDEVLTALCQSVDKLEETANVLAEKQEAIERSVRDRGNPQDDIKSASGEIYVAAKRRLQLTGVGNDTKAFMRSTLAPLLEPNMNIYQELRRDIFGE